MRSLASFPGSSGMEHVYAGRAWYLFPCDHDVIEIGPEFLEQKGNVFCCCSTNYVFNAWCEWYSPPDG